MAMHPAARAVGPKDPGIQQVLTFELDKESYGVEILRVREIRGWTTVTKIPHAPPFVLGVLNLRGTIVPVVDLRLRLGLERVPYTKVTVVVVLTVNSGAGRREVGIVVDSVSDVTDVVMTEIKEAPPIGARSATDYIRGLLPAGNRMIVLLDIDRLIDIQVADLAATDRDSATPSGSAEHPGPPHPAPLDSHV